MQQARTDPTEQIKEEIRQVPKKVLDIVAKNPEKEHVPGDVQEARMEKHAGNQGQEQDFKTSVSRQESRESSGDGGVREEQCVKGPAWEGSLEADFVDKYSDVGKDQRDIDEGIGARGVEVLERNEHGRGPQQSSETRGK